MIRGRKPVPMALRILRGNPGHRRLPVQLTQPVAGADAPSWLSAEARREWDRLEPELRRLGVITILDCGVLAAYAEALSAFAWSTREIQKHGRIARAANGTKFTHPLFSIQVQAMRKIREFSAELGLSPVSRAAIAMPGAGDEGDDNQRFFGPKPTGPPKGRTA